MVPLVGAEANEGLPDEELDAGVWFGFGFGSGFGLEMVSTLKDVPKSLVIEFPATSVKEEFSWLTRSRTCPEYPSRGM